MADAKKKVEGNWNLESTCPNGHTVYRNQMQPDAVNTCPYKGCGRTVN